METIGISLNSGSVLDLIVWKELTARVGSLTE